ncbi:hypothetical protein C7T94_18410 [Pedobacter yulinensis]|uniref:Uncharacterized protein n=1 Tax=Pedobacter yulinensis TaxID=2126353 RepID=A0A2T3HHD0_9SPHI|nr:formyltransferase family protein [Pedobacter yulinensis]PST81840.1 hypothetical protein C7T94_18410 [Pedobacter yulinensis]
MKVILLSSHVCGIPVLHQLCAAGVLTGVASIDETTPYNLPLEQAADALRVPFRRMARPDFAVELAGWISASGADLVLVFGFRWKIPAALAGIPRFGFINIHFSLLPAFRGPDPLFWQLRSGGLGSGITLHQVDESFDTGPILLQKELAIIPGETRGMCSARFAIETVPLVNELLKALDAGTVAARVQDGQSGSTQRRVQETDLAINWEEHAATDIINLVNAANPDYQGAVTVLKGQEIRILEVTPATAAGQAKHLPGTIVLSHPDQGVFVACLEGSYLRINIIATRDGVISGFKLAAMGIMPGERLSTLRTAQFGDHAKNQPNIKL